MSNIAVLATIFYEAQWFVEIADDEYMCRGSLHGLKAAERGTNEKNHLNWIRPENTLKYLGRQRNLHNIPRKIPTIQCPMQ